MTHLARVAAASAAATVLILASAPTASAGSGFTVWINEAHGSACDIDSLAGNASFVDEGEYIYLSDKYTDGYGIAADIYVEGVRVETVYNNHGAPHTSEFNRSYDEGSSVEIEVFGYRGDRYCGGDSERGTA